ncbi:hypothetical protein GOODEAATRI_028835 [Goodea atripinnis]|uniref:Secreted protein n=1 Tax=Goodea atripinnis TaxID=208336 RepID=A0ABV0PSK6_9TELE
MCLKTCPKRYIQLRCVAAGMVSGDVLLPRTKLFFSLCLQTSISVSVCSPQASCKLADLSTSSGLTHTPATCAWCLKAESKTSTHFESVMLTLHAKAEQLPALQFIRSKKADETHYPSFIFLRTKQLSRDFRADVIKPRKLTAQRQNPKVQLNTCKYNKALFDVYICCIFCATYLSF